MSCSGAGRVVTWTITFGPVSSRPGLPAAQRVGALLTELQAPAADRLAGDGPTTLQHQLLHLAEAERETEAQPHTARDHLDRVPVTPVRQRHAHHGRLPPSMINQKIIPRASQRKGALAGGLPGLAVDDGPATTACTGIFDAPLWWIDLCMTMTVMPNSSHSSRRTFLTASAAAAAATGAAVVAGSPGGRRHGRPASRPAGHRPAPVPRTARAAARDRPATASRRPYASWPRFGTRHTLSTQDDPQPRHRRRPGLDPRRDEAVRRRVRRPDDRRTPVVRAGSRPRGSRPRPASPTSSRPCAARSTPTASMSCPATTTRASPTSWTPPATRRAPTTTPPGVAVAMELARVMAERRPAATIVFAAVAGEEQGLYGAAHMAEQFKAAGADVQAHVHQRHRRQPHRRRRHPRPVHHPALRRGRAHLRDPGSRRTPAARSAARTTRRPASSPASSATSPTTTPPACTSG